MRTATFNRASRGVQFRAAEAGVGEVFIYDEISASFADELRRELAIIGDVATLRVYINSPGGSVFAAWGAITLLQRHRGRKIMHIDGVAASAASAIACCGDEIVMAPHALWMMHNAYQEGGEMSNSDRDALRKINRQLVTLYAKRSGLSHERIETMMEAETWLDSRQAMQFGFADRTYEPAGVVASWDGEWKRFGFRNAPKPKPTPEPEYRVNYVLLDGNTPNRFNDDKNNKLAVIWDRAKRAMQQDRRLWRTCVHEAGHAIFAMRVIRCGVGHAVAFTRAVDGMLGYVQPKFPIADEDHAIGLYSAGHEAEGLLGLVPGYMQDCGAGSDYRQARARNPIERERDAVALKAWIHLQSFRSAIAHVAYLLFRNPDTKVRESTIEMHLNEIDFADHPDWHPLLD